MFAVAQVQLSPWTLMCLRMLRAILLCTVLHQISLVPGVRTWYITG